MAYVVVSHVIILFFKLFVFFEEALIANFQSMLSTVVLPLELCFLGLRSHFRRLNLHISISQEKSNFLVSNQV